LQQRHIKGATMTKTLTPKQEKFACEMLKNGNASESYRIAYDAQDMSAKSIGRKACALKANPLIIARLEELQKNAAVEAEIIAADVLKIWWDIATADPNVLMQLHILPCPHCYEEESKIMPSPNPSCMHCHGAGIEQVHLADTRKLSGAAKRLYGGVKRTKYGAELILRNQDAALANIAKYLGMFDRSQEALKPNSGSMEEVVFSDDPIEASRVYQKLMRGC
jgi:phage terminase small subunit